MAFSPYFTPQFSMKSSFVIERLISQVLAISLNSFTAATFISLLFSSTGQVCFGIGWELSEIILSVIYTWRMKNCKKILLNDMCDFESCWTG